MTVPAVTAFDGCLIGWIFYWGAHEDEADETVEHR